MMWPLAVFRRARGHRRVGCLGTSNYNVHLRVLSDSPANLAHVAGAALRL